MQQKTLHMHGFGIAEVILIVLVLALLVGFLFPLYERSREKDGQGYYSCSSNQRQIATAFTIYANENNDTFPDAATAWVNIDKYDGPRLLRCPGIVDSGNAFVFNAILSRKRAEEIKDPTSIFLTADGTSSPIAGTYPNVAYSLTNIDTTRHKKKFYASFVDGHVQLLDSAEIISWLPATSQASTNMKCSAGVAVPLTTTIPNAAWEVSTGKAEDVAGLPQGGMLGGELTFNKSGIYMITAKGTATANGPTTVYHINVGPK
ncbi:MAG: hypothetical protein WCJ56_01535 [bacterium]